MIAVLQACGGKVVAEGGTTAGVGGQGGAGGGASDACGFAGPANPNGPCHTEGAMCFYADTSCAQQWTCNAGQWSEAQTCTGNGFGGFGSTGSGG